MSTNKPEPERLRRIHLFAGLDHAQLDTVRAAMHVRELDDGERLFDFGQPPRQFFYLEHGQIKLFRDSPQGNEKVIEIVRGGETFAEAVMFMQNTTGYPVSAEAIAASRVWAFDSDSMISLLRCSTETCFRLMASLSVRLRQQIDEIERLTLHNATYRVVAFLLQQVPADALQSTEVNLSMPKNILASRLGIQPETFSRILGRLSHEGLVRVQGNGIVLQDVQRLQLMLDPALGNTRQSARSGGSA